MPWKYKILVNSPYKLKITYICMLMWHNLKEGLNIAGIYSHILSVQLLLTFSFSSSMLVKTDIMLVSWLKDIIVLPTFINFKKIFDE